MKRIPFGGLKLRYPRIRAISHPLRDNEENPLRGIETSLLGIDSVFRHRVTMKRIPFGGLKRLCTLSVLN